MAKPEVLPYGVALREVMGSGSLFEMKQMLAISGVLLDGVGKVPAEDVKAWRAAHGELLRAVGEREPVTLDAKDVVALKDSLVVFESPALAARLRPAVSSDLEGNDVIYFITIKFEF
jgi:hypothetical protein